MKKVFVWSYALWVLFFIVVPIILVCYFAFNRTDNRTFVFTLDNIQRALQPIYLKVFMRSICLALVCTAVCFLIGYPVAYILAERNFRFSSQLLFLLLVPMWMNMLLRTYSWLAILENNGVVNSVLAALGLPKFNFLYRNETIVLGMVYNFLPFMILPIYNSLKKINLNIIEAAQDLGAGSFTIFLKIVLPLSMPGVFSGVAMVFMPALTSFIVSNLLGGGKFMLVGNLIEQQFLRVADWNFGCAISFLLIVFIFFTTFIFSAGDKNKNGVGMF